MSGIQVSVTRKYIVSPHPMRCEWCERNMFGSTLHDCEHNKRNFCSLFLEHKPLLEKCPTCKQRTVEVVNGNVISQLQE